MPINHARLSLLPSGRYGLLRLIIFIGLFGPAPAARADYLTAEVVLPPSVAAEIAASPAAEEPATESGPADLKAEVEALMNRAYQALNEQRFDLAQDYIQEALRLRPGDYDLTMMLAQVQEKKEDWPAAEASLSQIIAARPDQAYALASRGFARMHLDRLPEAEQDFQASLRHNPDEQVRANVLSALEEIGRRRLPAASGEAAARPDLADLSFQAYDRQQYDQARQLAEQALADQPGNYHLHMLLADIMGRQSDWAGAEKQLDLVLSARPDDAYALASRGFARLSQSRPEEAAADFRSALEHDPAADQRANIQAALMGIERDRERQQAAEAAPAADGGPAENRGAELAQKAYQAYNQQQYDQARQLAEQALADQPGDYHLNMLLVNILNQKKDWAAAEARLTQILAGRPDDAYALASRGFARLNQTRRSLAAEDFRRALEQSPGADLLANVRGALNQIKRAEVLERAAGRQPRRPVALGGGSGPSSAGGRLLAIQKLVFEQQLDRAAQELNQIMGTALTPKEKGLWHYLRAEVLWRQENHDQAFPLYQNAQRLLPEPFYQAEIWWRLAEYERGRNQAEAAMEYARKSVELFPDNEVRNLQAAYLFLHFRQDAEAVHYFETALKNKAVPEEQAFIYMDLSYAYKRLGDNQRQQNRLERYVDLQDGLVAKQSPIEKKSLESLYDARREHADLVRRFGWYSGNYFNRYENGDYAFQVINDFYWQPWRNNGRSVQLYGQIQATLASRYSSAHTDYLTGRTIHSNDGYRFNDSLLAAAGIRVDPLADHNLVLTLEKLFKIGRQARDDFRGRVGYSWDTGLELEPFEPNWLYTTFFNELTHSFQYNDSTYYGEARWGRSFRLDCLNDRLVVSPHLTLGWGYGGKEIAKGERWSLEAGPGLHFRQWYREDKYNAPQSYTDLVIQYRFGLSHNRDNALTLTLFNSL